MSASSRLQRAVLASAKAAGCAVRVASMEERPWSSATFVGARHAVRLNADAGAKLSTWLDALGCGDLMIAGHVVAELSARLVDGGATLEVLTLEA